MYHRNFKREDHGDCVARIVRTQPKTNILKVLFGMHLLFGVNARSTFIR